MKLDFIHVLKFIELNRMDFFTTSELAAQLKVQSTTIQSYLETLANNGLINRLEKGKYCRIYIKDKYVIGSRIIEDGIISYQSALDYHNINPSPLSKVYVSSEHQKSNKTILNTSYHFIKIGIQKMFGFSEVESSDGKFRVTDKEKTILDCLDLPKYVDSYTGLFKRIKTLKLNPVKLLEYGMKTNNLAIIKRLGYILDKDNRDEYRVFLNGVKKVINSKYTLLDPSGPDEGPYNSDWKIRNNLKF